MTPRILCLILLSAAISLSETNQKSIVIRLLTQPGTLEILNTTDADISLRGRLIVERKRDGVWIQTPVVFQTIETCDGHDALDCVKLSAHSKITPVRWDGHTCSGQCTRSCRSNHYNGPGTFRFLVQTCDGKQKFVSESFDLGPEGPPAK